MNDKNVKFNSFRIRNIVAILTINSKIDLASFYYNNKNNCRYVQEVFPGFKYKPYMDENVIAIIFDSGKITITGALNESKISDVAELVYRRLLKYRK